MVKVLVIPAKIACPSKTRRGTLLNFRQSGDVGRLLAAGSGVIRPNRDHQTSGSNNLMGCQPWERSSGIFSFRRAESKVSRKSFFQGFFFCNFTSATKEIRIRKNQNNPNPKKTTNS
jgi:hypothetical protein